MLIENLKLKFEELKEEGKTEDSILIALKEILQQYVLHFIYTDKEYSALTMYGGSVLRIGYDLPRMSEDLDFQTNKEIDLDTFSEDIKKYFKDDYFLDIDVKKSTSSQSDTQVLFIKFNILEEFEFTDIKFTKLQIRVDINHFDSADLFINDTIPGGKGTNLAYTIKTYPLSTLMASKTVAFLKRDTRNIGDILTNVKPRDVYDMMWYMNQRILPDLQYLNAKGIEVGTFLDFRDKVKLRVTKIEDKAFRNDLAQFFYERSILESWLSNWRVKFIQLLDSYEVYEVGELEQIYESTEFFSDTRYLGYTFTTLNNETIGFVVSLSDYWFRFTDKQISSGHRVPKIEDKITKRDGDIMELDYEYIGLFYTKIKDYIKRNKNIVFQDRFDTKLIRVTADNLKPKKQICLDKRLLEKVDFEELL